MSNILVNKIKEQRPNLLDNTIKTYVSILTSLHKKVFGKNEDISLANFKEVNKIMEVLKDKPASTRKTSLSALFILTNLKDYQDQMKDDIQTYKNDVDKQEQNDKQKDSFMSQDEIKSRLEELRVNAEHIYKKNSLTPSDINEIQNYILLALTSGIFIPPRRSLDWTAMKLQNVDKEKDNYIDKNKFVFNQYKGSNKKGAQIIAIPKQLQAILKKWLQVNNNEFLLIDVNGNALNSIKVTQRLNKILKDGSAVNVLRRSYLSTKYQDTIKLNEELAIDLNKMGSSKKQEASYIKKIDI